MIKKVKVTAGYAAKLPALQDKTIKFGPGLNILFGPNGCGKTTLVKLLGAYSGTKAGWSRFVEPRIARAEQNLEYPEVLGCEAPGDARAKVEWDGTASFLMSPETGDFPGASIDDAPDGIMGAGDLMAEMMGRPSSGQSRLIRLNRFLETLKKGDGIPDLTKLPSKYKDVNDTWQKAMKEFADYAKTLPRDGPVTILLDEIDRSLSLPNQAVLWLDVLPAVAKRYQVIAATHCPFALAHNEGFQEMGEGYVQACRKAFARISCAAQLLESK